MIPTKWDLRIFKITTLIFLKRYTEKPFDMDELILQPGLNTLSAYGFGSLTLSLHEEVL